MSIFRESLFFFGLSLFIFACEKKHFTLEDQSIDYTASALFNFNADILWVVDNSESMQKYQELLLNEMDTFLGALAQSKIDFRLGLTSTDMRPSGMGGKFIGSPAILIPEIKNWKSLFKERFVLGEDGSNLERSLDSFKTLLHRRRDFLRPQVPLVLIFLTDEEDYSLEKISYYIEFLDLIKPKFKADNTRSWQAYFFGILTRQDSGPHCSGKTLIPGRRYLDLVRASEGFAVSICAGDLRFQEALTSIKKRIVQFFTDYKLGQIPKAETIEVYIDGNEVSEGTENGWLYHSNGNFIRFYGKAIPDYNSRIKINFSPLTAKY